ncbi:MAG: YraN family protein [Porticoccaceae bacterium]
MFSNPLRKSVNLKYPSSLTNSKAIGEWSEKLACDWLKIQGLKFLERNYFSQYGEIDLIMAEQRCLVFVEVRYRKNSTYGSAEESITLKKCQRLTATAESYLLTKNYGHNTAVRFDAIAISPSKELDLHCTINWIQNILV